MENEDLNKTLLSVYRYLPRVANAIDKLVKSRAYNSASSCMTNISFNSSECVANSILNLSERKITLINVKIIIEKGLKSMKPSLARVLIWKYIDGLKSSEIAEKLNICIRSYFRKIKLALSSFEKALFRLGYFEDRILKLIGSEKWIMEVYNSFGGKIHFETENIMDNLEFRNKIKNTILVDFKKQARAC